MYSKLGKIDKPYYSSFKNNILPPASPTSQSLSIHSLDLLSDNSDFLCNNILSFSPICKKVNSLCVLSLNQENITRRSSSPLLYNKKINIQNLKCIIQKYNSQIPSNSSHKINISGNKDVLIDRIQKHEQKINSCRIIQRYWRGFKIRYCESLRFAFLEQTNRNMNSNDSNNKFVTENEMKFTNKVSVSKINWWIQQCTNKTDFFSLQSLNEIPKCILYFYIDNKGFIYGFNIFSLLTYFIKNRGNLINPYNRENIDLASFYRFFNLSILVCHVYPSFIPREQFEYDQFIYHLNSKSISQTISNRILELDPALESIQHREQLDTNIPTTNILNNSNMNERLPIISNRFMTQEELIIENLIQIRNKSIKTRIINVFIEIDNLLHYHTNHNWLLDLNKNMLIRFYHDYNVWWNSTEELLNSTKQSICIFNEPFLYSEYLNDYTQLSLDDFREACIHLIENMIYGGIDDEHRKLGAFQVLKHLAKISLPARIELGFV